MAQRSSPTPRPTSARCSGPNGIEIWVETYVRMFCSKATHNNFEDKWKPKLIIMHSDGPFLAEKWGGAKNGIYSSMSHEDWAAVLPKPNWAKARIAHGHVQ